MLKNDQELWQKMDDLNVSKVFVLFTVKNKKKDSKNITTIQSVMVATNCGKNEIDWNNDICSEKSYLTRLIQMEFSNIDGKIDGMLVYNCKSRKAVISGTHTKKVREKFKKEL